MPGEDIDHPFLLDLISKSDSSLAGWQGLKLDRSRNSRYGTLRLAFIFIVLTGIEADDAQHDDVYILDTTGSDIHDVKLANIGNRKDAGLAATLPMQEH